VHYIVETSPTDRVVIKNADEDCEPIKFTMVEGSWTNWKTAEDVRNWAEQVLNEQPLHVGYDWTTYVNQVNGMRQLRYCVELYDNDEG